MSDQVSEYLVIQKVLRISEEDFARAKLRFHKYGVFSLLVASGKLIRYIIVSWLVL